MSHFGYHGRILHLDMTRAETRVEAPPEAVYRITAGAGILAARMLFEHTPARIDPLGPDNLLIFANSVVSGFRLPGLARHVVCAKSPLTHGIGEARVEGPFSADLKRTGFDSLVFHGAASRPTGVLIDDGAVSFFDAGDLWGMATNEATDVLEDRYGSEAGVAVIGPAGENLVRFASILSHRTHQAQRMGMGAVMGSKKLKAIVVKRGSPPAVADAEACERIRSEFVDAIPHNVLASWQKNRPGFAVWVHDHGIDAALDVDNFRTASFAHVDDYDKPRWAPWYRGVAVCPAAGTTA